MDLGCEGVSRKISHDPAMVPPKNIHCRKNTYMYNHRFNSTTRAFFFRITKCAEVVIHYFFVEDSDRGALDLEEFGSGSMPAPPISSSISCVGENEAS
jgi:hypothetical protein